MFLLTALLACATPEPVDSAAPKPETPTPPEPEAYSGGSCPTLEQGRNEGFLSADVEREFLLQLPENPEGAPVVFVWHWLGGSASQFFQYTDIEERLTEELGAIVVAPESCCSPVEWLFVPGQDPTPDLTLFDDLLSCLDEQYSVDLDRVYTTGMSAGGLWSSFLAIHRAETLAAAAPLSGGTEGALEFETPARPLPVLLTWGGESDTIGGNGINLDFHEANLAFSADLQASGSWVGHCVHSMGHTIHPDSLDILVPFFRDHRWSDTTPPWALGMPEELPDWCGLPGDVW
ncbi:MAG: hypothetical protein H6741_30625 [Alphaproteobacteria bacterium]|nr:hypothetical protein [Alphaproteobacteria bacterium]